MRQVHDGKERDLTRGGLTDDRPKGERSKACREKSAEAIVPSEWSTGRAETYGGWKISRIGTLLLTYWDSGFLKHWDRYVRC